jgi:hypothetical protein
VPLRLYPLGTGKRDDLPNCVVTYIVIRNGDCAAPFFRVGGEGGRALLGWLGAVDQSCGACSGGKRGRQSRSRGVLRPGAGLVRKGTGDVVAAAPAVAPRRYTTKIEPKHGCVMWIMMYAGGCGIPIARVGV